MKVKRNDDGAVVCELSKQDRRTLAGASGIFEQLAFHARKTAGREAIARTSDLIAEMVPQAVFVFTPADPEPPADKQPETPAT